MAAGWITCEMGPLEKEPQLVGTEPLMCAAFSSLVVTGTVMLTCIDSYHSTNNSQVDAYASGLTQMVIDISSDFAP